MIHAYCSICQESFNNKSEISAFQCGHVFHSCCLSQWLKTKSSCPNCRCIGVNNLIKKIYFDEVSDANNSFVNDNINHNENEEVITSLRNDINRMQIELDSMINRNKEISTQNLVLTKSLNQIKNVQHIQDISVGHAIDEKDEEIAQLRNKIYSLRFISDILSKSQEKVEAKVRSVRDSTDVRLELDNVCNCLVALKKDLSSYKDKTASLMKDLSRLETKNRILEAKLESQSACIESQDDSFKTPSKGRLDCGMQRALSTPQMLLLPSPEAPGSSLKRRLHQDAVSANPFSRNVASKKARVNLSSLSIMQARPELWTKKGP